ncbi:hypothetical protein HYX07_03900 [Candidatus Woesearchaeota archaeon]|nr:hypothetical protein [Candidatus Woesearchaeota archaeon]
MLFSKLKAKTDELLPPPPPFPSMELEEEKAKPAKTKAASKDEFEDLFKEVESLKVKKEPIPKIKVPKTEKKETKKPIAKLKEKAKPARVKPATFKETKLVKKLPEIKIKAKLVKPVKAVREKIQEPEPKSEDFEFPELEEKELEFDGIGEIEARPNELQEAKDEIKSAIEKIKGWDTGNSQAPEKQSFFQRLFAKKRETPEENLSEAGDDISLIKSHISRARESLMKFDLESAKKNYIEIMKIYNKISPEQQAKVYREISDLYSERKSAEELKI